MRISDWSSDVCSSDLTRPAGRQARAPRDRGRYSATGRSSPRIGGQRLDHNLVEHRGLPGVEDAAHREKMAQRLLLQFAHHFMRLIDRLGHARAIAINRKNVVEGERV